MNWAVQADVIDRSVQADRLQGTRGAGPTVGEVGGGVTRPTKYRRLRIDT